MAGPHPRLTLRSVRARYNGFDGKSNDPWHRHTAQAIRSQLRLWKSDLFQPGRDRILNAGSGGDDLGIGSPRTIHLDIAERRLLSGNGLRLVGSVDAIPLSSGSIDSTICVGSVINYCDAATTITELGRVSANGAKLALEFESSLSGEFVFRRNFGSAATIVETFYGDRDEIVWGYRPDYMRGLLNAAGFVIVREAAIHVLSPWLLLALKSLRLASAAAALDSRVQASELRKYSSNHLWLCAKSGAQF